MSSIKDHKTIFLRFRRAIGGIFLTLGYILSPLSWWNDAVINVPLAYAAAWLFSRISPSIFLPAMVAAYWATNVIGLLLMHLGGILLLRKDISQKPLRLRRMIIVSTVYTLLMILLVRSGILPNPF